MIELDVLFLKAKICGEGQDKISLHTPVFPQELNIGLNPGENDSDFRRGSLRELMTAATQKEKSI